MSTLSARKIWFDDSIMRLNVDGIGRFLGEFQANDKILTVNQNGTYQLVSFELSSRFSDEMIIIEKWKQKNPLSVIYYDHLKKTFLVKRFQIDYSDKIVPFIPQEDKSTLELVTSSLSPIAEVVYKKEKGKERSIEQIELAKFITVKGITAQGNKLTNKKVNKINLLLTEENSLKVVELTNEETTKSSGNQADSQDLTDLKENDSNKIIIDEDSTDNQFRLEL